MNMKSQDLIFSALPEGRKNYFFPTSVAFVVAGGGMVYGGLSAPEDMSLLVFSFVSVLFLSAVFLFDIIQHINEKSKKSLQLKNFAVINGYEYGKDASGEFRPGSIFLYGRPSNVQNVVKGNIRGFPFEHFTYKYVSDVFRDRREFDAFIIEVTLPRTLPHLVIDSLVEGGHFLTSTLPIDFDTSQRMRLEGDFYKYFEVYAPKAYSVSALSIIAPNVMLTLLRQSALCDIEIIDNKLYFYWPELPYSQADYKNAFETVEKVLADIGDDLATKDIFSTNEQMELHAQPHGVRLKRRGIPLGLVLLLLILAFLLGGLGLSTEGLSLIFTLVIYGVYFWKKRRRMSLRSRLRRGYDVDWETANFG